MLTGAPWKSTARSAVREPSAAGGAQVTVSVDVTPDGTNLRSSDGKPTVGILRFVRTTATSPSRSTSDVATRARRRPAHLRSW